MTMPVSWLDIALFLMAVSAVLAAILIRPRAARRAKPVEGERRIEWQLDARRSTEIISNELLGMLQRSEERGGMLRQYDLVIVWAREFLDDDILYHFVRDNIRDLVRYLYILDRRHANRFRTLVERLKDEKELDAKLVEDAIDVILIRSELLLNNFVLLAAGTDHQEMYSGIIYESRPFAWVRQDRYRAHQFLSVTQNLVKAVGVSWYGKKHGGKDFAPMVDEVNRMFELDDQIMDFSEVGRIVSQSDLTHLEDVPINLQDIVSRTTMPPDVSDRIGKVVAKIGPGAWNGPLTARPSRAPPITGSDKQTTVHSRIRARNTTCGIHECQLVTAPSNMLRDDPGRTRSADRSGVKR